MNNQIQSLIQHLKSTEENLRGKIENHLSSNANLKIELSSLKQDHLVSVLENEKLRNMLQVRNKQVTDISCIFEEMNKAMVDNFKVLDSESIKALKSQLFDKRSKTNICQMKESSFTIRLSNCGKYKLSYITLILKS